MYLKINLEGMREVEYQHSMDYSLNHIEILSDIAAFGWTGAWQMEEGDLIQILEERYELKFLGKIWHEEHLYVFEGSDNDIQGVEYDFKLYGDSSREGYCQVVNILPEEICENKT